MAALPGGEVAFCFTDIEGSTRLARQLGEAWPRVLDHHNALLRDAWAAHGGVEVKTEGDAFFVAFDDVADALAAVIAAHRALEGAAWPDGYRIRVRAGVHVGEATIAGHDYVGVEVHRAARVAAAGHGGQTLLSGPTADRVAGRLPAGVTLRDLGRFALKDFDEGERLVLVEDPEVAASPAAPSALPFDAHNVPLLRTTFLGRETERVEVAKLCDHHQVVTLVGPGGVGKTRLALEVARVTARDRSGGAWAVLLAGERRDADIVPVIARTLGIADAPGVALLDAVTTALAGRAMLVVLDNCEHVRAQAAAFVDRVTSSCPDVHILATSRQPLGLPGEKVVTLDELTVPASSATTRAAALESDAVALFADRAEHANPRFVLSDETVADVVAICRAVDGLPLAIELAAAMTRAVPLPTLAARVTAGTIALRSSDPTQPERTRTLDDLIGWSYDLLDEAQTAVLRRLAVFRGGWTVEAAEAVCGASGLDEGSVLPALADLADHSLVAVEADGRYRMLVLIRSFALARLREAGEADDAAAAHLTYYRSLAGTQRAAGTTPAILAATRVEMANLQAALATAMDRGDGAAAHDVYLQLGELLLVGGHYGELARMQEALQPLLVDQPLTQARLLANRAQLRRIGGDLEGSLALLDEAERRLPAVDADARTHLHAALAAERGENLLARGDQEGAAAAAEAALAEAVGPIQRASLLEVIGRAVHSSDPERALDATREAADSFEQGGESVRAAMVRLSMVNRLCEAGREEEAVALLDANLRFSDEADVPRMRGQTLYLSSCWYRSWSAMGRTDLTARLGDPLEAMDEAVAIADVLQEVIPLGAWHAERAVVRALAGRNDEAAEDLAIALPRVAAIGHAETTAGVLAASALVLADRDDAAAPAVAAAALAVADEDDDRVLFGAAAEIAAAFDGPEVLDSVDAIDLVIARLA